MKLAYVVKLGWKTEFEFDNIEDAGTFAVQAKTHRTEISDDDPISINVIDIDVAEEVDDD